jgi:Ran GTPase-activating protein (RanGAP) involved in mRNA processing and transport
MDRAQRHRSSYSFHGAELGNVRTISLLGTKAFKKTVTELVLSKCYITTIGAVAIAKFLSDNPPLQSLDISDNNLSTLDLKHIFKGLCKNKTLKVLMLNACLSGVDSRTHIPTTSPKYLQFKTLTRLDVSSCSAWGGENLGNLFDALCENSSLARLNISDACNGSFEFGRKFARMIEHNSSLTHIISNNQLDGFYSPGLRLGRAIRANKTLKVFSASYSTIRTFQFVFILEAFKAHPTIRKLYLAATQHQTSNILNSAAEFIANSRKLRVLDLSLNYHPKTPQNHPLVRALMASPSMTVAPGEFVHPDGIQACNRNAHNTAARRLTLASLFFP